MPQPKAQTPHPIPTLTLIEGTNEATTEANRNAHNGGEIYVKALNLGEI